MDARPHDEPTPPLHILVIGAGLSGATVARQLAEAGWRIDVVEKLPVAGGHCRTRADDETGIAVHECGAHVFHTASEEAWAFVNRHARMEPYIHTVQARVGDRLYPLPVTLRTINAFFGTAFGPEEARAFIESKRVTLPHPPRNLAEQAVSMFGPELYEAFFRGYTEKQWGRPAESIPASVLARLPFRFNNDPNYFSHPHQGLPRDGYTRLVDSILAHPNIALHVGTKYLPAHAQESYDHVVYTGPLDEWFGYAFGRLPYRTLAFETETVDGDYQGCPVVNYCDASIPYTRIIEHKFLSPWARHDRSVISREFSREASPDDEPFYPVHLAEEQDILKRYRAAARESLGVTFVGRLATFRYIDMDVAIAEALQAASGILRAQARGGPIPALFV